MLRAYLDSMKAISILIFIECAREFKDNDMKLVLPPADNPAKAAMAAASVGGAFKNFVLTQYESTLKAPNFKQGDWAVHREDTAIDFNDLYLDYEASRDKTDPRTYVDRETAKGILNSDSPAAARA